jgi:hypothetical protein
LSGSVCLSGPAKDLKIKVPVKIKGAVKVEVVSIAAEEPRNLHKKHAELPNSRQSVHASTISPNINKRLVPASVNQSPQLLQREVTPSSDHSNDPSDAFETDGFWSEDMSGSEDLDVQEYLESSRTTDRRSEVAVSTPEKSFLSSKLSPAKVAMIDSLMNEFWVIFGQEWSATVQKRGNIFIESSTSEANSSPSINSQKAGGMILSSDGRGKRRKLDGKDDDASGDDDDDREPKRPKTTSSLPSEKPKAMFACPYRKHNPRTYHTRNRLWRTCALNSFENIARLKYDMFLSFSSQSTNNNSEVIFTAIIESSNVLVAKDYSQTKQNLMLILCLLRDVS